MAGTTVRVRKETHEALRALADATQESIQDVVAKAVESYRRDRMLREVNTAYAALRADREAWQAELAERQVWEGTLSRAYPVGGEAAPD